MREFRIRFMIGGKDASEIIKAENLAQAYNIGYHEVNELQKSTQSTVYFKSVDELKSGSKKSAKED